MFISGSSTSSRAAAGSPRKSCPHLVDLVEQEDRVVDADLVDRLDDAAGQRADVSAPVAADLGLIAHPAERHAGKLAAHRPGDRARDRGLADAGRADQAEDRAPHLAGQLQDGKIFEDPLFDLFQAVMVFVQDLFDFGNIEFAFGLLFPGQLDQPVKISPDDRRLRRPSTASAPAAPALSPPSL